MENINKLINIVYYTYINPDSNYKSIIKEQLIDINNSKIYINATLFIVISCEFKNLIDDIKNLIYETMINIPITYNLEFETENIFEYYGIKKIYDLSIKEPNKYYLYMHGKGMCNTYGDKNPRTKHNIFLTKSHVNNWEKVLDIFKKDDNINIIGMFPSDTRKFIWFNFWWASGKYLITCEYPKISRDDRFYYESWIGTGNIDNNKIYNLLENNYNTYTPNEAVQLIWNLSS